MKEYLAQSKIEGAIACHDFMARDRNHAEAICYAYGWELLGSLEGVESCSEEEMAALIESVQRRNGQKIH
jgi:hypothetical protein